ncbi:glutathione S-transferase family protein [Methylopila musalis]|uniref:Glutathione S-transferase family protein n=1 Tax=Methylopila musalis TaxID=1134781 RepID=A0ABW3Z5P6_9HYPH
MGELVLTTFDWVPEPPRGFVRDLRVRWAMEEAGLPYRVATTPFEPRDAGHLARQPFGQVPWLTDGDRVLFESGAILLHLGELSDVLLPSDPAGRGDAIQWVFAALNSVEAASLPWSLFRFADDDADTPGRRHLDAFLAQRLDHMERALGDRDWLAGRFSVADILMADVLRLVERFGGLDERPACRAYVARATVRPAFRKALADQLAGFAAADARRAGGA